MRIQAAGIWDLASSVGLARLRDPRRPLAVAIIGLVGGLMLMVLFLHRDGMGADALAYWHGTRTWLEGGDPYRPAGPWWPYVYAPWLLPVFVPWALLPWPVAWIVWEGAIVALVAWSVAWAYERRPLPAAIAFLVMSIPIGLVVDSANIALFLTFGLWAMWFAGPRTSALLWALATAIKWFPAVFFVALPRAARPWAIGLIVIAVALSLATWQMTLEQIELVGLFGVPTVGRGSAGVRVDHLVFLWALVPLLWGATGRRLHLPMAARLPALTRTFGPHRPKPA